MYRETANGSRENRPIKRTRNQPHPLRLEPRRKLQLPNQQLKRNQQRRNLLLQPLLPPRKQLNQQQRRLRNALLPRANLQPLKRRPPSQLRRNQQQLKLPLKPLPRPETRKLLLKPQPRSLLKRKLAKRNQLRRPETRSQ